MSNRKHKSYTLWLKWLGVGWSAEFTASEPERHNLTWPESPILVLESIMTSRFGSGDRNSRWRRSKRRWMILPTGQVPAESARQKRKEKPNA